MIKAPALCLVVVHLIVLDVYLLVSESGYRTVPVTLSIDNSDTLPMPRDSMANCHVEEYYQS